MGRVDSPVQGTLKDMLRYVTASKGQGTGVPGSIRVQTRLLGQVGERFLRLEPDETDSRQAPRWVQQTDTVCKQATEIRSPTAVTVGARRHFGENRDNGTSGPVGTDDETS